MTPEQQAVVDEVNAELDGMLGKYDGRILAACLVMRAAHVWNGLRQAGYTSATSILAQVEVALGTALDDSQPPAEIADLSGERKRNAH